MHKVVGVLSFVMTIIGLVMQFSDNGRPSSAVNKEFLAGLVPTHKYWILSTYDRNIVQNKAIAKYSEEPLAMSAVVLRIEDDTLYTTGILGAAKIRKKASNVFGVTEKFGKRFNFFYQPMDKSIMATNLSGGTADWIHRYRPISESEYLALMTPGDVHPLQKGMNKLFVKELFAGEYTLLNRRSGKMAMSEDGKIEGFQKYSSFVLHDYFGTSHPFNGLDVIWMEDQGGKGKYYNWVFAQDTLTLTEMKDKNEAFFLGEKSWIFLKTQ